MRVGVEMQKGNFKEVFTNKNFLILWIGHIISVFGNMVTFLALPIWVHNITGSRSALAITALLRGAPIILLGLFAGVLVDRWNRKRIMISSDLIRAVLTIPLIFVPEQYFVSTIYVIVLLKSIVGIFFNPAVSSTIPAIIEKKNLNTVNSLIGLTQNTLTFIAPLAGMVLITAFDFSRWILMVDLVSFVVSAIALYFVKIPPREDASTSKINIKAILADAGNGLMYIKKSKPLIVIMVTTIITMFGQGFIGPLWLPYVVEVLNKPAEFFSKLVSNQGLGSIAGAIMVMLLGLRAGKSYNRIYSGFVFFLGCCVFMILGDFGHIESSLFLNISQAFKNPAILIGEIASITGFIVFACTLLVIYIGLKVSKGYKYMYSFFVLMTGVTIFAQVTTSNFNIFIMWGFLVGIFISGMNVSTQTIMQHATKKEYMGRISSAFFLINQGFYLVSVSIIAIVGDFVSTRNLLVFACSIWLVGCLVGSIAMLFVKEESISVSQ